MKGQPTFLLYGIHGLYNYGCEAIVRGTMAILRDKWPECEIVYASRRPEEDKDILKGEPINVISCGSKITVEYISKAILRKLKITL